MDPDANPTTEQIPIRRTAFFSGNVQGVGFRYTACQVSSEFDIVGYVKNLFDGRVELVAEGTPQEVDRFIAAIEQAMAGFIEYTSSTDSTAQGQFESFSTQY